MNPWGIFSTSALSMRAALALLVGAGDGVAAESSVVTRIVLLAGREGGRRSAD
jgi:hypothetical protein